MQFHRYATDYCLAAPPIPLASGWERGQPGYRREVFDFLVFLKSRQAAREEGREDLRPLAQTAWAADWNTPEEDEAWRDL